MLFSDDGQTLILGTGGTIIHWDLMNGTPRKTLRCHVTFWPEITAGTTSNGNILARGSSEGEIQVLDADTGMLRHTTKGHPKSISSLAFSPDGLTLASGSWDKTIKIWDAVKGTPRQVLKGHSSRIDSLAFSPDGLVLASGLSDQTINLWDLKDGTLQKTLRGHSKRLISIAFSPDGLTLASGSSDHRIMLWDLTERHPAYVLGGQLLADSVTAVEFSPDGKTLASGFSKGTIQLWATFKDTDEQASKKAVPQITEVNFSPDGTILLSASNDGSIGLWDTETGELQQVLKDPTGVCSLVTAIAMSNDGLKIASAHEDKQIRIWDTATGKIQHNMDGDPGDWGDFESLIFSPDGSLLASSSRESYLALLGTIGTRSIKLWDTATSTLVQTFEGPSKNLLTAQTVLFSPDGHILLLLFEDWSPAENLLPKQGGNTLLELYNISTGNLQQTLKYPSSEYDRISSVAFSRNSESLELTFTIDTATFHQLLGDHSNSANLGLTKIHNVPARLSQSDRWIAVGGENILWLPAEYYKQNLRTVIKGSLIAFGLGNGRTSIIGFDVDVDDDNAMGNRLNC